MNIATITNRVPIKGAEYIPSKPETKPAWLAERNGGITATNVRDWGKPEKRRQIVHEKVTGESEDISNIPHVKHGVIREPKIAEWVQARFGIAPCDAVYKHPDNPRFIASPDGVSLDPFTGALVVGTSDAALSEIKASKHDLTPGKLDSERVLIEIEPGSAFDRSGYYVQMQWQMFVMNAVRTLFVWEQRSDRIDPETDTYEILGPPEYAWIPRDQQLIEHLVTKLAPGALEQIDQAKMLAATGQVIESKELPAEHLALVAEYIAGRNAEAEAKAAVADAVKKKDAALKQLKALYENAGHEDMKVDLGIGTFTLGTTEKTVNQFDKEAATRRAPALIRKYEELVEKYTKPITTTTQGLTITPAKPKKEDAS